MNEQYMATLERVCSKCGARAEIGYNPYSKESLKQAEDGAKVWKQVHVCTQDTKETANPADFCDLNPAEVLDRLDAAKAQNKARARTNYLMDSLNNAYDELEHAAAATTKSDEREEIHDLRNKVLDVITGVNARGI